MKPKFLVSISALKFTANPSESSVSSSDRPLDTAVMEEEGEYDDVDKGPDIDLSADEVIILDENDFESIR
jgi:hypothetical protein